MLTLLASGKLVKDPIRRTSSAGKLYCTLLLSAPTDEEPVLVNAIAFGDVAERLLKFSKDDSLTLLGRAKLRSWEQNGETKSGLSLTVDKALSPYDLSRKRDIASEPPPAKSPPKPPQPAVPELGFDDDLPF